MMRPDTGSRVIRGALRGWHMGFAVAFGLACVAGRAWPQDVAVMNLGGGAFLRLEPCDCAPAVARIVFHNEIGQEPTVHLGTLSRGGISVSISLDVGFGDVPDTLRVLDAGGYIAVPPEVTAAETGTVEVLLYTFDAVGS